MKDFNFETYQKWFNDNYSDSADYYLDEGWFPDDGEIGIHTSGSEIFQLVYPEGFSIGDFDPALAIPALQVFDGLKPDPNFKPEIQPYYKDLIKDVLDEKDLIYKKDVSIFHHNLILLPFKMKYLSFFEIFAKDITELCPQVSLLDFLENDT